MNRPKVGLNHLTPFDDEHGAKHRVNVIIETPSRSTCKYKYDAQTGLFELHKILPAGFAFPFDFGFIPATQGEDGDPLDVIVLIEQSVITGCLVRSRLIGVLEFEQTSEGKTIRNDRLIAVADASHAYHKIRSLNDVSTQLMDELENFFVAYLTAEDKQVKPLGRFGAQRARKLVEHGAKNR